MKSPSLLSVACLSSFLRAYSTTNQRISKPYFLTPWSTLAKKKTRPIVSPTVLAIFAKIAKNITLPYQKIHFLFSKSYFLKYLKVVLLE